MIVTGEVFRRLDHAGNVAEATLGLRTLPATVEAVMQGDGTGTGAPAHVGGVVLDIAHAFDTARQDHVGCAGLHHHCGIDQGL
ncbi:hypothetical protein D9M70_521840 [compost metagenome]